MERTNLLCTQVRLFPHVFSNSSEVHHREICTYGLQWSKCKAITRRFGKCQGIRALPTGIPVALEDITLLVGACIPLPRASLLVFGIIPRLASAAKCTMM